MKLLENILNLKLFEFSIQRSKRHYLCVFIFDLFLSLYKSKITLVANCLGDYDFLWFWYLMAMTVTYFFMFFVTILHSFILAYLLVTPSGNSAYFFIKILANFLWHIMALFDMCKLINCFVDWSVLCFTWFAYYREKKQKFELIHKMTARCCAEFNIMTQFAYIIYPANTLKRGCHLKHEFSWLRKYLAIQWWNIEQKVFLTYMRKALDECCWFSYLLVCASFSWNFGTAILYQKETQLNQD